MYFYINPGCSLAPYNKKIIRYHKETKSIIMLSEGEINKTEQCVLLVRSRLSIKRESSRGSNEPFPLAMKHDEEDQRTTWCQEQCVIFYCQQSLQFLGDLIPVFIRQCKCHSISLPSHLVRDGNTSITVLVL